MELENSAESLSDNQQNQTTDERVSVDSESRVKSWPGLPRATATPPLPFIPRPRVVTGVSELLNFPDIVLDHYIHDEVGEAAAISIRGDMKRYYGSSRQDSCAIMAVDISDDRGSDDSVHFLVIADGVSNSHLSHFSSKIACKVALETLKNLIKSPLPWRNQASEVFRSVSDEIQGYALKNEISVNDLYTTLRIAKVIQQTGVDRATVLTANVGDGKTMHLTKNGINLLSTSTPNQQVTKSTVISTSTAALPGHFDEFDEVCLELESGEAVVLATDGAVEVWNAGLNIAQLIVGKNIEPLELAWALSVESKGHMDDRSFVVWKQM